MYRVLNSLLELGLVHKIASMNSFVACEQSHQSGLSILAICEKCGSVEEFTAFEAVDELIKIGAKHEFKSRELAIELKGCCSDCS